MSSLSDEELALYEIIEGLHRNWSPLPWQIGLGHSLFYLGNKDNGAQCGRSSGKTDIAGYCTWRYAMQFPGSENYIFEPLQKQAKEILWAPQRLQTFGPKEWIKSINNTEMRITFWNGSFIKLDGSDNVDALRGIKPKGLVVYDELKDHKPAFIEAMEPNRARYDAPALYLGTPPEIRNHYVDIMEDLKRRSDAFWTRATSFDNHHNSRAFLQRQKEKLIAQNQLDVWLREYEAIFVKGSKYSIFPQVLKMSFPSFGEVKPKDLNKWVLVVSFDPASTSTFGVVFLLFNPYSKRIIVFDELYVQNPIEMTASEIYKAVKAKLEPLYDRNLGRYIVKEVEYVYDEAAAWFRNEINEIDPKWWLAPSNKVQFGVDGYINLIRAVMNRDLLIICNSCPKLIWELESYIKDENGKVPKENDHNINALQYGVASLGLDLEELKERVIIPKEEPRGYKPQDEIIPSNSYAEID